MKKLLAVLIGLAVLAPLASARDIAAFVDPAWLEASASNPRLVIMDMRKVEDYKAGHIPASVNVIGASVYVKNGSINNEVPPADDLTDVLQAAGVGADSLVVVVESDGSRLAWATRVGWTLKYAGLDNVAILDGGYAAWIKAGKAVQTEPVKAMKGSFVVKWVPAYFADKAAILGAKGAQIVDARNYDTYFGLTKQAFVAQAGHLPGAIPLPSGWITTADGLVKPVAELGGIVNKMGLAPGVETIVYCDSGVLATTWWWILSESLGWKDVRSFDGSSQVMAADPNVKFAILTWR
ncbi:MAG TPA: rhodanese-like domain-containing protein [Rectinemataceae bacterium]|nr:rhodanese-like domain-containing protein [Rectinemataceae bacterium]